MRLQVVPGGFEVSRGSRFGSRVVGLLHICMLDVSPIHPVCSAPRKKSLPGSAIKPVRGRVSCNAGCARSFSA